MIYLTLSKMARCLSRCQTDYLFCSVNLLLVFLTSVIHQCYFHLSCRLFHLHHSNQNGHRFHFHLLT